jgi:hypothetical protein
VEKAILSIQDPVLTDNSVINSPVSKSNVSQEFYLPSLAIFCPAESSSPIGV